MTAKDQQSRAECRKAFEFELIDNHAYVPSDLVLIDGFYADDDVQRAWECAEAVWKAARALPAGMEPEAWRTRHRSEPGMIGHYPWTHTGRKPRQMVPPAYDIEPLYTVAQVLAMQSELEQIGAVAACFGADWPDVEGEPEVLRRVKWAARQLKAAQARPPLKDERIREIDDETHFHEAPDWPVRFARAIEAAQGIK